MLYIIMWIGYVVVNLLGSEIAAYIWHRCMAHNDIIPGLHEAHRVHHTIDDDNAAADFIWLMFFVILFELLMGLVLCTKLFPEKLILVTTMVIISVFFWNWMIHSAYHTKDSIFKGYKWFEEAKEEHFMHHRHPDRNYGIVTHMGDKLFGTYMSHPATHKINI